MLHEIFEQYALIRPWKGHPEEEACADISVIPVLDTSFTIVSKVGVVFDSETGDFWDRSEFKKGLEGLIVERGWNSLSFEELTKTLQGACAQMDEVDFEGNREIKLELFGYNIRSIDEATTLFEAPKLLEAPVLVK